MATKQTTVRSAVVWRHTPLSWAAGLPLAGGDVPSRPVRAVIRNLIDTWRIRHRATRYRWMRDFNINPMGVAWEKWCQKSVVPPLVAAVPPLLPLVVVNDQKISREPRLSSLRNCQRFVDLFYNSSSETCFMWNFVLYVMSSSCTRLSNISIKIHVIFLT